MTSFFTSFLWLERRMLALTCRQLADATVFLGATLLLMGHFGLLAVGIVVVGHGSVAGCDVSSGGGPSLSYGSQRSGLVSEGRSVIGRIRPLFRARLAACISIPGSIGT